MYLNRPPYSSSQNVQTSTDKYSYLTLSSKSSYYYQHSNVSILTQWDQAKCRFIFGNKLFLGTEESMVNLVSLYLSCDLRDDQTLAYFNIDIVQAQSSFSLQNCHILRYLSPYVTKKDQHFVLLDLDFSGKLCPVPLGKTDTNEINCWFTDKAGKSIILTDSVEFNFTLRFDKSQ